MFSSLFTAADVVAVTEDPAPDSEASFDGSFSSTLSRPVLNDSGQVLFSAGLKNASQVEGSIVAPPGDGLFLASSQRTVQIARDRQSVAQIEGVMAHPSFSSSPLPLNNDGQAVFVSKLDDVDPNQNFGLFLGSGSVGSLAKIVREGDPAPDANGFNGEFSNVTTHPAAPGLNAVGEVAFRVSLRNTDVGHGEGIFRGDSSGNPTLIVRTGQAMPNSDVLFPGFTLPSINDSGQVAFASTYSASSTRTDGVYVGDGDTLTVIAEPGDLVPNGGHITSSSKAFYSTPTINNKGDVAFIAEVQDQNNLGQTIRSLGVFVGDGSGLDERARGPLSDIYSPVLMLNERGDVAYLAVTEHSGERELTLLRSDGSGTSHQVVRDHQRLPSDDGAFRLGRHLQYAMNDTGQFALLAEIRDDSGASHKALFFYDDVNGLQEIVREGSELNGSEILTLTFSGQDIRDTSLNFLPSDRDGFNEQGQVAFAFRLKNNVQGIAVVNTDGSKVEFDYGDAPDSYHTHLTSGGARHIATGPMLGSSRDSETDGQPTEDADGDDLAGANDDDGIVQSGTIIATDSETTTASFAAVASSAGFLDAWIDFNRDGLFNDANEKIYDSVNVAAGTNVLPFIVPITAQPGSTYARFRISSAGGLAPNGRAADGEVEDYLFTIEDGTTGTANVIVRQPVSGEIDIDVDSDTNEIVVRSGNDLSQELLRVGGSVFHSLDLLGTGGDDLMQLFNLNGLYEGSFNLVGGEGHDELHLTGSSQSLDLENDNLSGVEVVDIVGSGDNSLTLSTEDVIRNSPARPMVRVRHNEGDTVQYVGQWTAEPPKIDSGPFTHILKSDTATIEVENTRPFHNPLVAADTNRDNVVTAIDALIIINRLNAGQSNLPTVLTTNEDLVRFAYFDTNADQHVTAIDALLVINYLNAYQYTDESELVPRDLVSLPTKASKQPTQPSELVYASSLPTKDSATPIPHAPSQTSSRQATFSPWVSKSTDREIEESTRAIDIFFHDFK